MPAPTERIAAFTCRATVPTARASRYLQQLCKHWSHRLEVEFDPAAGRVAFGGSAVCRLAASPEALSVTLESAEAEALPRLREVVADHLRRFAFREELVFDWDCAGREAVG